jgi:TonB family protein
VQLFTKSLPASTGMEWFRDPAAIAVLTFQDGNNRSSPARPSFDQAERDGTQFAEAVFQTRERRGQSLAGADMTRTIDTTISVGGSSSAALGGMQPVRVGGNIRVPQKIVDAQPVYPPIAQSARVAGVVILEIRIEADGSVSDAKVLRSIPLLDQAALDCVKQWKYEPTFVNGTAVPIIMTVTVNFALQGPAPDSPPSSSR